MTLTVTPLKTSIYRKEDSLDAFIGQALASVPGGLPPEDFVIAVTSKIVSISERATRKKDDVSKTDLIKSEADRHLGVGASGVELTIKHGLLIPSAGIDESNSESGDFILFPEKPFESARKIHRSLSQQVGTTKFGVILTDSSPPPLRRGVVGVSLAHWGFEATRSFIGNNDLFGRTLAMTRVNVVDSLASMAVFAMGEAAESSPLALITGVRLDYTETSSLAEIAMNPGDDLYSPLLKSES